MYMGEALTALDCIADAVTLLNPDLVTDVTTTPPEHKVEQGKMVFYSAFREWGGGGVYMEWVATP